MLMAHEEQERLPDCFVISWLSVEEQPMLMLREFMLRLLRADADSFRQIKRNQNEVGSKFVELVPSRQAPVKYSTKPAMGADSVAIAGAPNQSRLASNAVRNMFIHLSVCVRIV